jgi:hypothetical protein
MDQLHPYRPRVSRETRLLLTTVLIAIVALWVLARLRFPDRAPPQNPVQPLLTQLTPRPTFADLAGEVAALRPRVAPLLVTVEGLPGLRLGLDVAVIWMDPRLAADRGTSSLLGHDLASGLSLVRIESRFAPAPVLWSPESAGPRYFIASETSPAGVALRPVYVDALTATDNPRWPGQEWQLPPHADVEPGSFLFTSTAAFAGLVVSDSDEQRLMVPATTVLAEAARVLDSPPHMAAYMGIEVQPLSSALARATGATTGLIVTWVDSRGPADGAVSPGEVIEVINGVPLATTDQWDVQVTRLEIDQPVILGVRNASGRREVSLAAAKHPVPGPRALGLTLRVLPGVGAEVLRVDPNSAGERSGLRAGDVITRADGTDAPSPIDIRRAFSAPGDHAVIVAFTRDASRRVTALEP